MMYPQESSVSFSQLACLQQSYPCHSKPSRSPDPKALPAPLTRMPDDHCLNTCVQWGTAFGWVSSEGSAPPNLDPNRSPSTRTPGWNTSPGHAAPLPNRLNPQPNPNTTECPCSHPGGISPGLLLGLGLGLALGINP